MNRVNSLAITVEKDGETIELYAPQPYQIPYHTSDCPNLLALGTRDTGKSTVLRWDAIGRCLTYPGFRALIIRRKIPDLRLSHLAFIDYEMMMLGGTFHHTHRVANFPNGSLIQFSHCEKITDVLNYLSSEWDYIGFDELSTFPLEMFLQIAVAARTKVTKPYRALVRACSNPLGPGAPWMKAWFVDHDVNLAEYPNYLPQDYEMQFSSLEQNKYANQKDVRERLQNLPEHVRRAWLLGEFVIEGAYFTDFEKQRIVEGRAIPWHVIPTMPTWKPRSEDHDMRLFDINWIRVYRAIDWGYHPDPAVCLWIAVLPNKRAIIFKERTWKRTLAADVAKEIKAESRGMRIAESFCDPTMFIKTGATNYSIGEIFEQNGVPLTAAQNDRETYGYAVHELMNTLIDGLPQMQIVEHACPELVRTFPILQMDTTDARRIGDGPDHWVVALAYYCMGQAAPSRDPVVNQTPRWMLPKHKHRMLGAC